jgi:hypothetical protein
MKTLTPSDLETVTGGKDATPTNNDQLYSAIQGIQSSLNDLSKNHNQGFFSNQGLMFMTMALALRQSSQTTVVYRGGWHRNSITWRTSW